MSLAAETEYAKLVFDYESAVEAYTSAVYYLLDATSSFKFAQAMKAVDVGHAKCRDLRMSLHEARQKADSLTASLPAVSN